jgi:hypothetical protein
MYPIVQSYKEHASPGLRFDFSDPLGIHSLDLAVTYTSDRGVADDERLHLSGGYKRYNLSARAFYNPASFYDLVGPTKRSRKGYGGSLRYTRTLIRDLPKSLKLEVGASGFGGLERLPDAQNVAVSRGFDLLASTDATLTWRNLRASIGAADYEQGVEAQAIAALNGVRFRRASGLVWRGYPQFAGKLDLGTLLPIPNTSVWLRTRGGYSPGDRYEPFANFFFGGFGNNWVDHQSPKRYREYESFPGVRLNSIAGTNFLKSTLELNLPALRFRRAGALAFHANWARLSLFSTAIATNVDFEPGRRELVNTGAQMDMRFNLLIRQPLTFSVGYARAYEEHRLPSDEWMVSLKVL